MARRFRVRCVWLGSPEMRRVGLFFGFLALACAMGVFMIGAVLWLSGCEIIELDKAGACDVLSLHTAFKLVWAQLYGILTGAVFIIIAGLVFALRWLRWAR